MKKRFFKKSRRMIHLDNMVQETHLWRIKLKNKPEESRADMMIAIASVKDLYHPTELAKFYSQMQNGCATPQDFIPTRSSPRKRA